MQGLLASTGWGGELRCRMHHSVRSRGLEREWSKTNLHPEVLRWGGWGRWTIRKGSREVAESGRTEITAPVGVFSRGTTRISGSLSCGARV